MQNLRPHEDQNLWNFIFSMFFFVVLIGALWGIYATLGYFPRSLPVFDAVLLSLAAFRITRLIVYDKIARWFRELFADTRIVLKDGKEHVEVRPLGRGIRHTIYDLLQCPWCIGFWSGLIIVFCYFVFPWAWTVILFLGIAGASSFVQVSANAVGWHAENLKLEAQERNRTISL
jgi:hypothetical protein